MPSFIQRLISFFLIIIFSPIFVILHLLIFLDDGSPTIFAQNRIGKNGKIFKCYKLRSMLNNAEEILKNDKSLMKIYIENGYKIPESLEQRYTKYGKFLRKSSLDELPQLFNVLFGQMNLVGPRPIVPKELEHYKGEKRKVFLSMKPGMTGLWQVSGRSNLDYPERADFEISYKAKRSFALDIQILFKTFLVVIKRKGAH
jgi:lipopolysaccharide/colanic/teichoic acid biosynthesis glycosyltransferase